jgi:hypothetical protein
MMASFVGSAAGMVAALALTAVGTASSDVLVDGVVVARARGHPQVVCRMG